MEKKLKILIIDSDPTVAVDLEQKVKQLGFESCSTAVPDLPIDQLESLNPELAILGPSLDAETCLKCIHKLKIIDPLVPILASCVDLCQPEPSANAPFNDIYSTTQAYSPDEISSTIESAMEHKAECKHRPDLPVLIGRTQEMIDIWQKIRTVAEKDINLLITGETGTGKELIARSIHFYSQRNEGPLVKISCGALPDQLLESEVFGFDHAEVGRLILGKWGLPDRLVAAVGGHHQLELATDVDGAKPAAAVLHVADLVCLREGHGRRKPKPELEPFSNPAAELLGIQPDQDELILGAFREAYAAEREILG